MNVEASEQDQPFRWRNCDADVGTYAHGRTVTSYVAEVVRPAIAALDAKIVELGLSSDPVSIFIKSDTEDLRHETLLAFALALQSLWERQLRNYLVGCANELALPEVSGPKVLKAYWDELRLQFRALRGIPIEDFPAFEQLDTLQHLGNACRHGDGKSASVLWKRRRDLWPERAASPFGDDVKEEGQQPLSSIRLSINELEKMAAAIAAFWNDTEYIYNESIERKHDSLVTRLMDERATRTWLPKAHDYPKSAKLPIP